MTQPLPLSAKFEQASHVFKDLLEKFQKNLHDLPKFLQSWPETFERYKSSIREMPKNLRQRPFVKNLLIEIETIEREIRDGGVSFEGLQARARRAAELAAELENHPTFQKFLRGEPVLSSKKLLHWSRKITHASLGLIFLYVVVYSGWPKLLVWGITGGFMLWSVSLETARHMSPRVNYWVMRAFGPIMREREKTKINSAIFYMFSIGVVYFTTPVEVAVLTLLFLAIGDPFAGIIGVVYGRRKISLHATLEGSLACFGACAGLAALGAGVLFDHHLTGFALVAFSLISGLIGAVAEISFKKLDDNLVMPLLSAPALWFLMKVFSIL